MYCAHIWGATNAWNIINSKLWFVYYRTNIRSAANQNDQIACYLCRFTLDFMRKERLSFEPIRFLRAELLGTFFQRKILSAIQLWHYRCLAFVWCRRNIHRKWHLFESFQWKLVINYYYSSAWFFACSHVDANRCNPIYCEHLWFGPTSRIYMAFCILCLRFIPYTICASEWKFAQNPIPCDCLLNAH